MPSSFLTRSPRSAAPIAQPQDDEEDGQRVGTTGGMTVQQAGTWDAPKPTFSADPGVRRTQLADQANADFAAKQRADNPFIFSNDVKTLPQAGATRELGQAVAQGEHDYQEREQVVRQQASDATAAFNSKAEAQFRSRGQQFYTDPETRRLTPVVDEQGRALYHETPWETTTHPKTGTPVMGKRDRFGQPQFKELPIVPGEDATDEKMYYKTPEGDITSAGNISDLLAHPNYNVRRQAMAANTRRQKAVVQQTLGPLKELSDAATTDFQSAQNERDGLTQQVQQANQLAEESVGNDAQSQAYRATAQQLQSRLDGLNQSLNPKGELYTRRGEAARNYSIGHLHVLRLIDVQDALATADAVVAGRLAATGVKFSLGIQRLIEPI